AIKFVMEVEGYSFIEAVGQLAEEAQIPFNWAGANKEPSELSEDEKHLLTAHDLCAKWFHYVLKNSEQGQEAMNYLRNRGFTDQLIDTFEIGYAPPMRDSLTQFLNKKNYDLS